MSLYSALAFFSLALVSTYAFRLLGDNNNQNSGGVQNNPGPAGVQPHSIPAAPSSGNSAVQHLPLIQALPSSGNSGNLGSFVNFGNSGGSSSSSSFSQFFTFFNGVSDTQKQAFFAIFTNGSLSLNQVQAELNDWAVENNKSAEFQNLSTAFQQHLNTSLNYLDQTIANSSLSADEQATAGEFVTLITDPDTPRDEIHDQLQTKWDSLDNQTQADFLQAFGPIIAVIRAKFGFTSGGSSGLTGNSISSAFSQLAQQLGGSSGGNTGSNPSYHQSINNYDPQPTNLGQPSTGVLVNPAGTGVRSNVRSGSNGNRRNGNNRNSGSNRRNSSNAGSNAGILRRK